MTYSKARGTFINPGSPDHGDPRWFILDSSDPTWVRVFHAEVTRNEAFTNKEWDSGARVPKEWYNIEEEETVSEIKVGDRVRVEFEAIVNSGPLVENGYADSRFRVRNDDGQTAVVYRESITKLAPALPTRVGTVIDSRGYRFMLTRFGWHATTDRAPYGPAGSFEKSMYAKDFTVVLEGK